MKNSVFILISIFIIGFLLGLIIWPQLHLQYSNPWQITGMLTQIKFNPNTNVLRFIVAVSLPSLLLFILFIGFKKSVLFSNLLVAQTGDNKNIFNTKNSKLHLLLLLFFATIAAFNVPTFHANSVLDKLHEGESLGSAINAIAGQVPYKDYIFCHGYLQDPLRSMLGFKLFGQSIGASKTIESLVKIISFNLLAILIFYVCNKKWQIAFPVFIAVVFLQISSYLNAFTSGMVDVILLPPRDVVSLLFLILMVLLHKGANAKIKNRNYVIAIGIPIVVCCSFLYSVDRAFFILATFIISLFCFYTFVLTGNKKNYLICFLGGSIAGVLIVALVLGKGVSAFLHYVFYVMPQYHELMDGLIFPIAHPAFIWTVFLYAMLFYYMCYNVLICIKNNATINLGLQAFFTSHGITFTLYIYAICLFKSALGRADYEHLCTSSWLMYIILFVIILSFVKHSLLLKKYVQLCIVSGVLCISLLACYRIQKGNLIQANLQFHKPDANYISSNDAQIISYLKSTMQATDAICTITVEPIWYYFLSKPSPTRFPCIWLAMPTFYQQEVVQNLSQKKVKYILYNPVNASSAPDGIPFSKSLPIIIKHVETNYKPLAAIGDQIIWQLK